MAGDWAHEEPAICLVVTLSKSSITQTICGWSPEHTSSSWKATSPCSKMRSLQYGQRLTIATGWLFLLASTEFCSSNLFLFARCGNVAAILELDEHLGQRFKVGKTAHNRNQYASLNFLLLFSSSGCTDLWSCTAGDPWSASKKACARLLFVTLSATSYQEVAMKERWYFW